jgi:hypothetical protein
MTLAEEKPVDTEAAGSFEVLVPVYQAEWHHLPEDHNLKE